MKHYSKWALAIALGIASVTTITIPSTASAADWLEDPCLRDVGIVGNQYVIENYCSSNAYRATLLVTHADGTMSRIPMFTRAAQPGEVVRSTWPISSNDTDARIIDYSRN